MPRYPDGTIQTKQELETITKDANGVLYKVTNGNFWGNSSASSIEEVKYSRGAKVELVKNVGAFFFFGQTSQRYHHLFSLSDTNIGAFNTYNDHFVFADKEKAEAYHALAKQGWHKHELVHAGS